GFSDTLGLLAIGMLLIGACVFWIGWRGVRINTHPICSRCGFDLVALPLTSVVCSECGAELARARSVIHGQREKRRRPLAVGFSLGALGATVLAGISWTRISGFDLTKHKATWWLTSDIRDGTGRASMDAREEVYRRLLAGKMSLAEAREILEASLRLQADREHPMGDGLGDFVQVARQRRWVTDEQWNRFWRQAW